MAAEFVKGERVHYVQGEASEPAQIVKVHWEDGPPPYYTVRVLSTGRERQTDAAHLAKEAPLETVVRAAASVGSAAEDAAARPARESALIDELHEERIRSAALENALREYPFPRHRAS